jgi:hypothetical protein
VTVDDLEKDGGIDKWAYDGVDMTSGGPLAQSIRHALCKPGMEAKKEVYDNLPPALQARVRKARV